MSNQRALLDWCRSFLNRQTDKGEQAWRVDYAADGKGVEFADARNSLRGDKFGGFARQIRGISREWRAVGRLGLGN